MEIQFHDVCECAFACDHGVQQSLFDTGREGKFLVTGKGCVLVESESATDTLEAATLWKVLCCLAQDTQHDRPYLKGESGNVLSTRVATSLHGVDVKCKVSARKKRGKKICIFFSA